MTQKLYRHFNKNNELLYVGISMSIAARLSNHKSTSHWFNEVTKITIENYETREEVLDAEVKAIQLEKPKFNVQNSLLEYRKITGDNSIFLGVTAVSKRLEITPHQLLRMIKKGEFNVPICPFFKVRRWKRQDVENFITNGNPSERPIYNYYRKRKPSKVEIAKHKFHHEIHGVIVCTQTELCKKFDLHISAISRLVSKKRKIHKGWTVASDVEAFLAGKK